MWCGTQSMHNPSPPVFRLIFAFPETESVTWTLSNTRESTKFAARESSL